MADTERQRDWYAYYTEKRIGHQWFQVHLLEGLGARRPVNTFERFRAYSCAALESAPGRWVLGEITMATAAARSAKKRRSPRVSPKKSAGWSATTPCRDAAVDSGIEVLTAQHGMHLIPKPTSDPSPRLIGLPEVGEFSGKVSWQRSRPLEQPSVGPRRDLWLLGKSARTR